MRKKTGLSTVGVSPQVVETSPIQAAQEPKEAETSREQAEDTHFVRSFDKNCLTCGGKNEKYVKPNVFCNGPECKGVIPLGSIDTKGDVQKQVDAIKTCYNCGAEGDSLHVAIKE